MVVYPGATPLTPPNPAQLAQKHAAEQRARDDQLFNENVQQQRQQAPSSVQAGSPQDIAIRQEAQRQEQAKMISSNVQQVAQSSSQFAQQRLDALKSKSFNYGSVSSAFYSPPPTYVNRKGETVSRTVPSQGQIQQGSAPSDLAVLTTRVQQPPGIAVPQKEGYINLGPIALARTDRVRAEAGLPPLEDVMNVTITNKNNPQPPGIAVSQEKNLTIPQQNRSIIAGNLASAQNVLPRSQGSEVASFLKFPFLGQKTSTSFIPSTSLADLLAFVPIPLGIVEKGASLATDFLSSIFVKNLERPAENIIIKKGIGSADIGTNIGKYTEKFQNERNMQNLIREKQLSPVSNIASDIMSMERNAQNINLGRGLGRMVSREGGTSVLDTFGKGPEERPPSRPEKTVSAGKGLEQIVRQKEEIKKETPQSLLQKEMTKEKTMTSQEKSAQEFEKLMKKSRRKNESRTEQMQEQKTEEIEKETVNENQKESETKDMFTNFINPTKSKEEQRLELLILQKTRQGQQKNNTGNIFITKPKSKQTTTGNGFPINTPPPNGIQQTTTGNGFPINTPPPNGIRQTTTGNGFPINTPPPPSIPPTGENPQGKKIPPELMGTLGGSLTGGGGRNAGIGRLKGFTGNVPIDSIVGIYNRNEIVYGNVNSKGKENHSLGRFVNPKKTRIL